MRDIFRFAVVFTACLALVMLPGYIFRLIMNIIQLDMQAILSAMVITVSILGIQVYKIFSANKNKQTATVFKRRSTFDLYIKSFVKVTCILMMFSPLFVWLGYSCISTPSKPKTAKELRQERIKRGFSAWDGSHIKLEQAIKKSMNDPDSFKHVETSYSDMGGYLIVQTTFRGKNAFGALVKNTVQVKTDLDGNIISDIPNIGDSVTSLPKEIVEDNISVSGLMYEEQTGKAVRGGKLIRVKGIVSFDIKREQVKPSLLAVITKVRKNNPKCEWIFVVLSPGAELGKYAHHAGIADYKEGNLTIRYGIPSDKNIKEWNSLIGKKSKTLLGDGYYTSDGPRLYRPDKETYEKGRKITLLFDKLSMKDTVKNDDEMFALVAKQSGWSKKEVERYTKFIFSYYAPMSWGEEEQTL